jgi:mono/diheme cytochrome c family protein
MNKRIIPIFCFLILVILVGTLLASCGSASTPTSVPTQSSSNGQALMQDRCSACHSSTRITSAHKTADQWKTTVDRMINKGAKLTAQEEQTLVSYLAQTYK